MKEAQENPQDVMYRSLPSEASNLLLVKANGGFGKTTRMKKYVTQHKLKAVWVELDSGCNQKHILFARLRQQIMNLLNKKEEESLHRYEAGFSIYENQEEELIRILLERLEEESLSNLVIVIDNVHVLWNEDCLRFLETIMNLRSGLKCFFVGREEPKFLIKPMMVKRCNVLEEKELYLSSEEVTQLVRNTFDDSREHIMKFAKSLMYYFEGWPAGIYKILEYQREKSKKIGKIDWERIICDSWLSKYVQYEIFDYIPPNELKFLKMTSLLPEITVELCNLVFQNNFSEEVLEHLERTNFFLIREKQSFFLIPAFQMLLVKLLSVEETSHIIHIIAEYYFTKQQYEKANSYLLSIQSSHMVQLYLEKHFKQLRAEEKGGLCAECFLYFINKGEPFSNRLLCFAAQLFNDAYDGKQVEEDCDISEREFYMTLLSYNMNPVKYRTKMLGYFDELKKKKVLKKLQVISFGQFNVIVLADQKKIAWRTKKGCELFAFLYHMKGTPIKRQMLLDVLWPDGIPKNAVTMLHNMIYNIRKELSPYGLEEVIQYQDKMYSLNMEWVESDFSSKMMMDSRCNEKSFLLDNEEVFIQYVGRYLENIDSHWTNELQEFYDKKYMENCMILADEYMKQRNFERALVFLQNIIKIDNLKEDALGKILICYGHMGERKVVRQGYGRFVELLKRELNVEPSDNLKKMYEMAITI